MNNLSYFIITGVTLTTLLQYRRTQLRNKKSTSSSTSPSLSSSSTTPPKTYSTETLELTDYTLEKYNLGYKVRGLFPLNFHYTQLNHGSYGVAPKLIMRNARSIMQQIESFPDDFMRRNALRRFNETANEVNELLHLNGEPNSIVFVENATAGVNAVMNSLNLQAGDAILINNHTYNACKNAAYRVTERVGAKVIVQQLDLPGTLVDNGKDYQNCYKKIIENFKQQLENNPNIKFAFFDHITSPTAIVMPVAEMCKIARDKGVRIMVDGAHAPGQLPLDMQAIGCDWYTGNLHKWVFALKGTAILYTRPERQAETQSLIISHFWKKSYVERFFMQGTNDQSRYLSSPSGINFITNYLGGIDNMRQYNTNLVNYGAWILGHLWGTERLICEGPCAAPFLATIECPINWRKWVRRIVTTTSTDINGQTVTVSKEMDASDLSETEAEAVLAADEGLNERIANAIFNGYQIQSVFYPWRVANKIRLWCRISAQVYNTLQEYRKLGLAVLDLKQRTNS